MKVWLVTVGETLPGPTPKERLHRSGTLSRYLLDQGHEVVWWGSAFDHFTKKHHFNEDTVLYPEERFRLVLFHGCGYRKNVSFSRIRDHRQVARKFAAAIESETPPDIILSSFPTIELCRQAVRYGKKRGVPVVLDVRDLWPDIFVEVAPRVLRPAVKLPLLPLYRQTREAFEGSAGLIGISPGYLDWGLNYARRPRRDSDALFPLGYRGLDVAPPTLEAAAARIREGGVDPRKTLVWFIGTFGRTYDLAPVIEAARRFQAAGRNDVQFVLSGSGENQAHYSALAQGVGGLVLTGWLQADEIAYLMTVAKVGLAAYAPGAPQGLPNKFFEYLSAGIPVLSSLQGEAAAVLAANRCGLSYRAGDVADLMEKLDRLLRFSDEASKMGARGKALFESDFSADVIYPKLVRFLERMAHSSTAKEI